MSKTTRIRTGMYSVLSVFVACLLLACLYGWTSARTSAQQLRELDSLTMEQLDKVNNAATWISRASANSHTAMLDRVNGDAAKAEKGTALALERLDIARRLITDMLASANDPKLRGQIEAMLKAFDAYKVIVEGQIKACRAGDLPGYIRISDGAKDASTAFADTRKVFTDEINARIDATLAASESRVLQAEFGTLVLMGLTLLLALLAGWFIARRVLAPLYRAGEHFAAMSEGDLTQRIEVRSHDEIGQLFAGLATLQTRQRDTLAQLNRTAEQLDSAAQELGQVTAQSNRTLNQQQQELEQAVTAVTEMTTAVEEVARNAASTSDTARESDLLANGSRSQVAQVLSELHNMQTTVHEGEAVIASLAQQASQIGKVLDVIRAVSEQTNLLALNAAIEAARAGDAGRGFAVVADEVRSLAQRTRESTLEIEKMIGSIQTGTDSAVAAIQRSNALAGTTLTTTERTGQSLERIFVAIGDINERNLVIASAAEEQAQVAREVDRNLINIRELAGASKQGADQIEASSRQLAGLTREIHGLAARFRV
ncbi:methyl-accepting chemotaxis protein [Pseudomonas oryzihabitans]|uniref:Methyl-accepting chemotaxis protein n=1 Tax=Pseudomonas oryzihabitans TaxID=47885 RepID=A0AAJ2BK00_9PSED|nr:methyl-accepting chemotaxis protein [Pseudomonas psychrotolerans]MDR6234245.1 methyl-accepting chemotaxis protein [Pseudomonas psychrotolerans]MDR6356640.1 methyl-accepting chemotaxis protein [Pseudomonas psychrotolerans]